MTHTSRNSFPSSNSYEEEDYSNSSQSQSLYAASQSETNSPCSPSARQFSFEAPPESVSESNQIKPTTSLSSTSNTKNFPKPITQIPFYIPIAPLPIFHGGPNECPVTHLSRFAKFCRANFSSPFTDDIVMMRVFPVTLENEAAMWYDLNIEPYASLTWDEIKSLFLQAYNKIDLTDPLRSELTMIRQGDEESVRSYFLRLQWILKRWPENGLPDNLVKGVFIDGMREEFRDWIVPQKPTSLNDALRLAFGFEQTKSAKRVAVKCGFCDGLHEEKGCEVRERMKKLWLQEKSKEEEEESGNGGDGDDVAEKELVRTVRWVSSDGRRSGGFVEEGGEKKKRQCQCWKHQCWKRKLERSNSLIVTTTTAANSNADCQ